MASPVSRVANSSHDGRLARLVRLVILASLAAPNALNGQWERYAEGRLGDVIERYTAQATGHPAGQPHWSFSMLPMQVRATYTGDSRSLDAVRDTILQRWVVTRNVDAAAVTAFRRELRFREGGVDHWLAVQDVLIEPMRKELEPGDEITLFVLWAGSHHDDGPVTWLFLVNEFLTDRRS